MKQNPLSATSRRPRGCASAAKRQQLLTEFDGSGLSAAGFARQHQICYATFRNWLRRRSSETNLSFAEVELVRPLKSAPLVLELGPTARLQLHSADQLELVAGLLKHLQASC